MDMCMYVCMKCPYAAVAFRCLYGYVYVCVYEMSLRCCSIPVLKRRCEIIIVFLISFFRA